MEKNNPRVLNAWCSYDLANSVYSLSITTAVFPVFYVKSVEQVYGSGQVPFFSGQIDPNSLYSWALSFSFLTIALVAPALSGIADFLGNKKAFMRFFAYLGSFSCMALAFFNGGNVEFGIGMAILASIGFSGSLVFYNSFLPEIATPDRFDRLSAKGFSMGYAGSIFLLLINLITILYPQACGFSDAGQATRFSFITVGLWWFGFSHIALYYLPKGKKLSTGIPRHSFSNGFHELIGVARNLKELKNTRGFVFAYFLYILGVITIIYVATLFASKELKMESQSLIALILLLQIVAIPGAFLFARISDRFGNKRSLQLMIGIWTLISLAAYFVTSQIQFFFLATMVGLVLGGIQSLSRSTFAKLIPPDQSATASWFSFFDATEKLATVAGTFVFGMVNSLTGSMRLSALALGLFFLAGFGRLLMVKIPVK